ncbi:hypothetical protein EJ04DRAFT_551335 [Polyplosphaeria fusca]|uniref:Uncharacterized protein n=1 Tax=Polyplosphaeria fusca TaxID=682080 RepID=A0A9P4V1K4_9PLEO|nr:hypothetical protein EJ04DRAFT_551335 [Polyplosphaeria fusca]
MHLLLSAALTLNAVGLVASAAVNTTSPTNSISEPTISSTSGAPNVTPPPIPTVTLPSLPTQFTDIPLESLECYDEWASARATNAFISAQLESVETRITSSFSTTTSLSSTTYSMCDVEPYTGPYTTLCDGLARDTRTVRPTTCNTTSSTATVSWSDWVTSTPAWASSWSSANHVPLPSCTPAEDLDAECYALHEAYSWRRNQTEATATANSTTSLNPHDASVMTKAEKPTCKTLLSPPPSNLATKTCRLGVEGYEMYYWPSAPQPGPSFCGNTTRLPGATRTNPPYPNTAVISGFTLTSPSIYHFLKGVAVSTSIGRSKNGRRYTPVFGLSTSIPTPILTLPQDESDVWTAQPTHQGRGIHAFWSWKMGVGGFNADAMVTAPAAPYFDACVRERTMCHTDDKTLIQANYRQYAAVDIKSVLAEWDSGEFGDCEWYQYWQAGQWHDREDVWIAPGQPGVATPVVTVGEEEPEATGAVPGSRTGEEGARATE